LKCLLNSRVGPINAASLPLGEGIEDSSVTIFLFWFLGNICEERTFGFGRNKKEPGGRVNFFTTHQPGLRMHDAMLKTGFNYIVVSFPG
jgi:hypothetical protein